MKLSNDEQQDLLSLARQTIEAVLDQTQSFSIQKIKNNPKFASIRGTFVTITKNDELRGCIGHILPVQEVYKDIIENAKAAAFSDPRFPPLSKDELDDIKIEISILDKPKEIVYKDSNDLKNILSKNKPGVILISGNNTATFLPQVWEELKNAEEFLNHLSQKAGLEMDSWKNTNINFESYNVSSFKE